jgi:hypothetical protein
MRKVLLVMSAVLLLGTPVTGHAIEVWYDGKHFESQEAYRQYRDSLSRQQIVQEPAPSQSPFARPQTPREMATRTWYPEAHTTAVWPTPCCPYPYNPNWRPPYPYNTHPPRHR